MSLTGLHKALQVVYMEVRTTKQIMIRPEPRKRTSGDDRELSWSSEYARLRARGYSHAQAVRLATLHTPD
jgi:hypothetical protein